MSKPDLPLDLASLRAALQALGDAVGVVSSPEFAMVDLRWRNTLVARELRNITAHTYARDKAHKVTAGAPALLAQAQGLLTAVESRHHE